MKCIEDEIPFDVPDGWEWSRIKNISIIGTGATPLKSNRAYYDNGDIAWVTSAATSDPYITKPTSYITKVALDETNCTIYQPGTLIIAMYGEGKTRGQISELSIQAATNQACAAISLVDGDYHFRAYIKAYFSQSYERLRNKAQGGQQPNLNQSIIAEMLVAIPPIKEVVRLIQYINEMLSNISTIECEKSNLQQVIDETKSRILDMAIRGQLVPQDSTNEPASVLLSRIRSEKEIMIKQGKLKRDKKESIIYKGDDNSYYHHIDDSDTVYTKKLILPPGWAACELKDVSFLIGNKDNQIKASEILDEGTIPVISQSASEVDGYYNDDTKAIHNVPVVLFGDHTRNVKFIDEPFIIGADGTKIHKFIGVDDKYAYYWMLHAAKNIRDKGYARHYSVLAKECFYLPPIPEQHRIVEAIDSIMSYLNTIESLIS